MPRQGSEADAQDLSELPDVAEILDEEIRRAEGNETD
jgi:hypothetical protein